MEGCVTLALHRPILGGSVAPRITIRQLPDIETLRTEAQRHYGNQRLTYGGLIAFVRHTYSNYDQIVTSLRGDFAAYLALKAQASRLIDQRLKRQQG